MNQRKALVCLIPLLLLAVLAGCDRYRVNRLPPAKMLMEPGPGVGGPGPGVMLGDLPPQFMPARSSQVAFVGPAGMWVHWDMSGFGSFESEPLIVPGRQNFPQGAIYRLKLTNIPGRPGTELYPTLEVGPATPRSEAFLSHNAIPVQLTDEDLDQVLSNNFVTKVIYLPDPEFQELALAGIETLVSTRLEPGVDPITEADRRGTILAILRLGGIDLEVPGGAGMAGAGMPGGVMQASYHDAMAMGGMPGNSLPVPHMGMSMTPPYVAGITAPQYGMPISGTPIGLPGPPHVPLGVPAGLQHHSIRDWTTYNLPGPTKHVNINVRQDPGYSYPQPANHAYITEKNNTATGNFRQSLGNMVEYFNFKH